MTAFGDGRAEILRNDTAKPVTVPMPTDAELGALGLRLLTACLSGDRATVRCLHCPSVEADRLRVLGVYEGACVGVVDRRNGVLLDVCGSRLALDAAVADAILVEPAAA
jgi:Fe2+ transport system protein FeoA